MVLAGPLAALLLLSGAPGLAGSEPLRDAILAFAPGLIGHSMAALLARSLLASGRARASAVGTAIGWLAVAVASLVLVATTELDRVVALGLASSIGLTLGALVLGVCVLRGRRG